MADSESNGHKLLVLVEVGGRAINIYFLRRLLGELCFAISKFPFASGLTRAGVFASILVFQLCVPDGHADSVEGVGNGLTSERGSLEVNINRVEVLIDTEFCTPTANLLEIVVKAVGVVEFVISKCEALQEDECKRADEPDIAGALHEIEVQLVNASVVKDGKPPEEGEQAPETDIKHNAAPSSSTPELHEVDVTFVNLGPVLSAVDIHVVDGV